MKLWNKINTNKSYLIPIIVFILVLAVNIRAFIQFDHTLYEESLNELMPQVEELSEYVELAFQGELKRSVQTLQLGTAFISDQESMFSDDTLNALNRVQANSGFQNIAIIDFRGNILSTNNQKECPCGPEFYNAIHDGEVYISNAQGEEGEEQIMIAVPLIFDDMVQGSVWGTYALSDIVDAIEIVDSSMRYFQIIDDKGHYISASKSVHALGHEGSIWEELEKYEYPYGTTVEDIYNTVSQGESGSFYFLSDSQGRYVNYRPLGINNWYLFSVQLEQALTNYISTVQLISMRFFIIMVLSLVILSGIVLSIVYKMYKMIRQKHTQLESLNSMLQLTLRKTQNLPFIFDYEKQQVMLYGYPSYETTQTISTEFLLPQTLLESGYIREDSLPSYQALFDHVRQKKNSEPAVVYVQTPQYSGWLRITMINPEINHNEQIIGVIENYDEQMEKNAEIQQYLDNLNQVEQKSRLDFLTGLYNREGLTQKIEIALSQRSSAHGLDAFFILDLDHFKSVNDLLGHDMGDFVLQETAHILLDQFRKGDIVGRLGGDEFVLYIRNVDTIDTIIRKAKKLNFALHRVYEKNGISVEVGSSIGIALVQDEETRFDQLYTQADKALYQVKKHGRNGYHIYSE